METVERKGSPPQISYRWIRGQEDISLDNPLIILCLGVRGGGKSVLLEDFGEMYLRRGNNVLDLFGASSGEGLSWLRSSWVSEEHLPVLLIRGESVKVDCEWPSKSWRDLRLKDLEENRIVISASPLYEGKSEEYQAAGKCLDILFERFGWNHYVYILIREASNLFYSRIKFRENQLVSKAEGIYLIRESRHHGLAMGLDSQKHYAVDSDFRALCDYIFIKSQGIFSLPRDYKWLYGFYNPLWLQNMSAKEFAMISRRGSVGYGVNQMVTWHKREREHIIQALGIQISKPEGSGVS